MGKMKELMMDIEELVYEAFYSEGLNTKDEIYLYVKDRNDLATRDFVYSTIEKIWSDDADDNWYHEE